MNENTSLEHAPVCFLPDHVDEPESCTYEMSKSSGCWRAGSSVKEFGLLAILPSWPRVAMPTAQ